jgi:diguanylate cyclase (GGDEF)-like protein
MGKTTEYGNFEVIMIKPPSPVDEYKRLEVLRSLNLLDTPPEERFDRVTRLARKVFSVPIALVSLVDADRQWFKSRQGLDATETPREISFCGHAILDDRIMVVKDAKRDVRFCDNPLVTCDPNIRFYAGYPISAPDGSKVGTLCIIDREPRDLSREELSLLRELGRMVEEELIAANMMRSDPVTGLSNRCGFSLVAEHFLKFCERNASAASLFAFHFANLKEIDSQFGHGESDKAAVDFAHMLLANYRDSDIVGRVAPDVFAVLLAGANLDGGDRAKQRLDAMVGEYNREPGRLYDMKIDAQSTAYNPRRHLDVEAFIQDLENRLSEAEQAAEEVSFAGGES